MVTMAEAGSISVCFMISYWGKFAVCYLVYLCVVMLQYFVSLFQVSFTLICYQSCYKSFLNFMWSHSFLGFFPSFYPCFLPVIHLLKQTCLIFTFWSTVNTFPFTSNTVSTVFKKQFKNRKLWKDFQCWGGLVPKIPLGLGSPSPL